MSDRKIKKLTIRLFEDQEVEILKLGEEKGNKFSPLLRDLLDLSLAFSRNKKTQKKLCNGVHYCTSCTNPINEFLSTQSELGIPYDEAIRQIMVLGIRAVNEEKKDQGKYCQMCRVALHPRKKHDVVFLQEVFTFCDTCYFSDKYKKLLSTLL